MSLAVRCACAIRERYGLTGVPSDDDLARVCAAEQLVVMQAPELVGRVREVLIGSVLALARGLDRRERRWLIAHGLGHWLMHEPGGYVDVPDRDATRERQEWQAELFAGWLLCCDGPIPPIDRITRDGVAGLAEYAEVPDAAALRWAEMAVPRGQFR